MLKLFLESNVLRYENGFNHWPSKVTRFGGEQWERVGSDLICGLADVFPDVGLIATGDFERLSLRDLETVSIGANQQSVKPAGEWAMLGGNAKQKSIYAGSEEAGWLFLPDCREAVEDAISWIMWGGFLVTAFGDYAALRERIEGRGSSESDRNLEATIKGYCFERALFDMSPGPGTWTFAPGRIALVDLIRLVEPVVARINMGLSD